MYLQALKSVTFCTFCVIIGVQEAVSFKLSSLQHELSESVPRAELEKANMEYGELVLKYQQCLQKQTAYASETSTIERLQVYTEN